MKVMTKTVIVLINAVPTALAVDKTGSRTFLNRSLKSWVRLFSWPFKWFRSINLLNEEFSALKLCTV